LDPSPARTEISPWLKFNNEHGEQSGQSFFIEGSIKMKKVPDILLPYFVWEWKDPFDKQNLKKLYHSLVRKALMMERENT
jgi:hypothetical protein